MTIKENIKNYYNVDCKKDDCSDFKPDYNKIMSDLGFTIGDMMWSFSPEILNFENRDSVIPFKKEIIYDGIEGSEMYVCINTKSHIMEIFTTSGCVVGCCGHSDRVEAFDLRKIKALMNDDYDLYRKLHKETALEEFGLPKKHKSNFPKFDISDFDKKYLTEYLKSKEINRFFNLTPHPIYGQIIKTIDKKEGKVLIKFNQIYFELYDIFYFGKYKVKDRALFQIRNLTTDGEYICILLQPGSINLEDKNIYEAIYRSHYDD